jgi:hypothetical protein
VDGVGGVKSENERVKRCGTSQVVRYRNRSFGVDEFVMMAMWGGLGVERGREI